MRGVIRSIRPLVEPRKMIMTGTPVSESPMNAFPILQILSPDKLPSRARFDRHFVMRPGQPGQSAVYSNLGDLKRMLESVSVRRLKADIQGMPEKTENVRFCTPTGEQAYHYGEIMKGILAEIEGDPDWARTLDIACVKLLRCRQVLNHPSILELSGESGKYLELDNVLEEILSNPDAKVVIWTEWNAAVDLLVNRYNCYGTIAIDQRTSQDELRRMAREFDSSRQRVAIATPAKGGTGIDFLSRARTAIYVERTYSLVNFRQSIDRIIRRVPDDSANDAHETIRINRIKRSPATIVYLHVSDSVDDIVGWVLQRKLDLGDALLTSDEKLLADGKEHLMRMLYERTRLDA